jgi:hypothetical protein
LVENDGIIAITPWTSFAVTIVNLLKSAQI